MDSTPAFRRLLRNSALALLAGAASVAVCYFFVDRPVAFFVNRHDFGRHVFWKWLTYPPPIAQAWAPLVLAALMIRRAWGPFRPWEAALLAAGVAIILADQFRESIAYVFGRDWPTTWIDDNPSLIRDGAYGFHPFQHAGTNGSFPSGHMARTAAVAAVAWIAWPKCRWVGVAASAATAFGLLAMNYHFVGDVVAGSIVGAIVGCFTAALCGLGERDSTRLDARS
ncbi:MAG: phosphatase PAP2 family protein [Planctomycetaceae bacterium]